MFLSILCFTEFPTTASAETSQAFSDPRDLPDWFSGYVVVGSDEMMRQFLKIS